MTRMNGGQIIVDYLIQENVSHAFGLCGHGNISFIDALYERSGEITSYSVRHESVSGFMADVYYRIAGRPAVTSVWSSSVRGLKSSSSPTEVSVTQAAKSCSPAVPLCVELSI